MRILPILFLLISFNAGAQVCAGPGRVPELALSICGSLTFQQPNVPPCTGPDIPAPECAQPALSGRSVWYKFHCYQSGTLEFSIAPASSFDDYDWHIHDYTGFQPQDVLTNNLRVSLNLSAATPNTGCSNALGTGNSNCEGPTNPFNQPLDLVIGHDYLLCVTNWSNSGLGYDLNIGGGTAVLTNNEPPHIAAVGTVGCNPAEIKVSFTEDILCSSLSSPVLGSEFTITNGTHVISNVTSVCNSGSNAFNELTLTLQTALTPGNYQLIIGNGTDLNTLLDVCEAAMPAGETFDFSIAVPNPLAIRDVSYSGCAPNIIKVVLSKPILCNSISGNGSQFSINPGNPVINGILSVCNTGALYTDTLQLVLQNPLPHGNYQLIVNAGNDGNILRDTCGAVIPNGYQFPFVIAEPPAPLIQSITFDECKPYEVVLNFSKPIACNSIAIDGTDFSVTPGAFTVTAVISNCIANGYTSQVRLRLSGNLPAGNFNVNINEGTDLNTVSDTCFSFMPLTTAPFTTTRTAPPRYDSVQYDKCTPSQVKVFYNKPINCGTVFIPGIEFYITGPSPVNIVSVSGEPNCSSGYSHWLLLQLAQPITVFGTYTLHNQWGPDGNSLTDTCFTGQDTLETISFNVLGKPVAAFEDSVHWGCVEDTIVAAHAGGNGINSWIWNFSDGTTASGQTVAHNFPVSTITATVQLIVSNGYCSDTLVRSYTLNNAFNAAFAMNADTSCLYKDVIVTNNSTGTNLQYLWDFGDNTTFNGHTPAPHVYAQDNNYTIELIASNDHGCADTAIAVIHVTKEPLVNFTGLYSQYCTGQPVSLTAVLQGNISSYTWNNGNAVNHANQQNVGFSYNTEANYTITLTATDRFCGVYTKDSTVQVYRVPVFSLGADKTLCPGLSIQVGTAAFPGYSYLWNTGQSGAQVMTGPQTNTYDLTVNNHGCTYQDQVYIKVLATCYIKVPGAFTPNNDGLNDRLKAINADLATNFTLRVYNRFGQLLFQTNNPLEGWDGKFKGNPADSGTYVWQLSYTDPVSKLPVYEKGSSILIR